MSILHTAVRPAISIQVRKAGTCEMSLYISQSHSKRASSTGMRASSGFMDAYGGLAVCIVGVGGSVGYAVSLG